ncbi:MAG: hypothetical protein IPN77_20210 [Sandaracinaceae bacterium]|nr:hypothetical protein [Sandaracinaceae bacterium]
MLQGGKTAATQNIAGSPLWMAPEQADSREIRPATDVWALGLIAFDALVGSLLALRRTARRSRASWWRSSREPARPARCVRRPWPGRGGGGAAARVRRVLFARCVERDPARALSATRVRSARRARRRAAWGCRRCARQPAPRGRLRRTRSHTAY